ncbi:3760_t:CDS:10 [Dentiscutata heterogama]|uniref:3760_t:CDS:1 n=1 Tax=Dentiscutata heterogama TaxID=1316150 RepID=A0ACA9LX41_9GLOM|nr:3760_t:CDS:10 [Dentiscutata heterogama]
MAQVINDSLIQRKTKLTQDTTFIEETLGSLNDYVLLGRSGLRVSPLCLGTETFGEQWGIGTNYEGSKEVFDYYFENGGNFIDTSNNYNFGESERFLGKLIAEKRSQIVVSTKYSTNVTASLPNTRFVPNAGGNHRKSLVQNLDESLKRLGIGYIDVLYLHAYGFRTPIEEIMRSLDDSVRTELRGWSRFIALQTRYNLLNRSMEFDLQPACAELDIGISPWGCVAEGFLTGKYTRKSISNIKNKSGRYPSILRLANVKRNWEILDEVINIATEIKKSPAQIALNWILQKPGVTSPVFGARTKAQIIENLKALDFKLTPDQMARLDSISQPKEIPFPNTMFPQIDKLGGGDKIQLPEKFKYAWNLGRNKIYYLSSKSKL